VNAEQRVRAALGRLDPEEMIAMLEAISDIVIDEREACARIADAQAERLSVQVCRSIAPVMLMAQAQAKRDVAFAIRQRGKAETKWISVGGNQ
jgi:hypothetical protein